jgi:8-oxo-dGTP diphosphatase
MSKTKRIEVAAIAFIIQRGKILLGKRKNCYGAGSWGLPGGHLKFDEQLVDAVCREIKEELGVHVTPDELDLASVVDDVKRADGEHYIHVAFELRDSKLKPKLMEPERCEEWRWFSLDALPFDSLFIAHRSTIENYLNKRLYTF